MKRIFMSLMGNVKMASIRISVSLFWLVDNNNLIYQKLPQNNLVQTLIWNYLNIYNAFITMDNFKFSLKVSTCKSWKWKDMFTWYFSSPKQFPEFNLNISYIYRATFLSLMDTKEFTVEKKHPLIHRLTALKDFNCLWLDTLNVLGLHNNTMWFLSSILPFYAFFTPATIKL